MKKILFVTFLILFVGILIETQVILAQALSTTTFKVGYFDPKGSKSGFIFGGSYSWIVDESVDIGIAVDYFRKKHTEETEIAESINPDGTVEKEIRKDAEFTTNIVPIYGVINVKFPAGSYLNYFLSGGLGYEMLFSKEKNLENATEKSRYYSGFKWIASVGLLYQTGSRSSFLAELFYDGTKVSRDKKNETGAPVRYEVDLSGFGFRIGVRMGFH